MPILLLVLLVGVMAYMVWRRRATTLTRDCRWREDRTRGDWHCVACGARTAPPPGQRPRDCLRPRP